MFHLIVTCVGSKNYEGPSVKNAIDILLQKEIRNDTEELFKEWKNTLTNHMNSSTFLPEASSVYKGSMWNASMEAFRGINEPSQLWIVSCGFGLINAKEKISGYHATFKSGVDDSVNNQDYFYGSDKGEVKKQWWNFLSNTGIIETSHPKSIHELVNISNSEDIVLIAAGLDYYEALFDDLNKIAVSENSPKLAFVGIQRLNGKYKPSIPKKLEPFIQSYSNGRRLQEFLGCGSIQVHPKSALYLIEQYNKTGRLDYKFP